MSIEKDRKRLSQVEMLEWLTKDHKINDMVTVYLSDTDDPHNHGIYCSLTPLSKNEQILSKPTWDLSHEQGLPSTVVYHRDGEEHPEYLRFGNSEGIEPLVIDREFYGMRDNYKELSEEFRLFHRLYHDRKLDHYIKFDDDGNEERICVIEPNKIQIRLKELRQFLAIKEMALSIQFDCREHSERSLEELKLAANGATEIESLFCYSHHYGDFGGIGSFRAFSRLLGKRLILPLEKAQSGMWGFTETPDKKCSEFIIGSDEVGEEITYTSDPDCLANYFGANPDAPNYLTPVHFRKQVLDKYYQLPSKYSVEDAILRCGYLWSLQIDNHHDEKVCAWLGDLGRDLPYNEQLHWRSHNIPPDGGMSKTFFKRQILAEFTDSDRPEHLFKQLYFNLIKACDEHLGWQLLLPLTEDDEHHFLCMRIPATDEQRDFDELVMGLTKILIDSLNEKQLNKLISKEQRVELRGSIARLEAALNNCEVSSVVNHISFLRKLQNLRSSSAAHRKGSNYRRIASEFNIESESLRSVFSGILHEALSVLEFFINIVRDNRLNKSEQNAQH